MAVKQRVLAKLRNLEEGMLQALHSGRRKALGDICHELEEMKALSRQVLPESGYAPYGEIYDGLLLAIRQMTGKHAERPQEDVILLCQELLQHIIIAMQRETTFKKEIVFLPYKAAMWDSLESIWRAAYEDKEHCNAYVVPIPYADRNPDMSPGQWHCERDQFPKDVPVLRWEDINLKAMHPDAIFIHNPYDDSNFVTSVDEKYYSRNIKHYTDLLVYSPYYVTSGGLGEIQGNCVSFPHVDYIIAQSESIRKSFAKSVPQEKIVALGSPKLDRVIRLCKNPPDPPADWRKKLQGKKVFFYNTSLNGLLGDTNAFLNKMLYVFRCFAGRKDVCLIWRPHPLLMTSLSSLRKEAIPYYEKVKEMFLRGDNIIYDDTPDIESTIAHSDVYVGDSATSVTMLFAISGKGLFILNNYIHGLPQSEDWRGDVLTEWTFQGQDQWIVSTTNHLYQRNQDGKYQYVSGLCDYHSVSYYLKPIEIENKTYICPANGQDILKISDRGVEERIPLQRRIEQPGAFAQAWQAGRYIFLIPFFYPAIVRFDTQSKRVDYIENLNPFFVKRIGEEWRIGGSCVWQGELLIASPDTPKLLHIDAETMEYEVGTIGKAPGGCAFLAADGDNIWFIPREGYTLRCWNPEEGTVREYPAYCEGLESHHPNFHYSCHEFPFGMPAFDDTYVYLPPAWGNRFVRLSKESGRAEIWKLPLDPAAQPISGYYLPNNVAGFTEPMENGHWKLFYWPERKLYDVDLKTGSCSEIPLIFEEGALAHEAVGFTEQSEWLRYGCMENAFHTLPGLIENKLPGNPHDRDYQLRAYRETVANNDGTAGEKTYQFIMEKLAEKRDYT